MWKRALIVAATTLGCSSGCSDVAEEALRSGCRGSDHPKAITFEDMSEKANLPTGQVDDCTVIVDLDGDGHEDILLSEAGQLIAYYGRGDFSFDRSEISFAGQKTLGCLVADLSGDGLRDIVIPAPEVRLFIQSPGRSFSDQSSNLALPPLGNRTLRSRGSAAADFDQNGTLDLYLGTLASGVKTDQGCVATPDDFICADQDLPLSQDLILSNSGGGSFVDATSDYQLRGQGDSFAAATADFDGDGQIDLLVGNDHDEDELYLSSSGSFDERAASAGLSRYNDTMGFAVADFDGDQRFDVYATDLGPDSLFFGTESGFQYEVLESNVVAAADRFGWGVAAEDFDNDGDVDIYVGTSFRTAPGQMATALNDVQLLFVLMSETEQGNDLGENCGQGVFEYRVIPKESVNQGLAFERNPVAAGDIDADGRVDILERGSRGRAPTLSRNITAQAGHHLLIDVRGGGNSDAIGAVIEVTSPEATQKRLIQVGSAGGHSSPRAHFGLGSADSVDVRITWPDGTVTESIGVAADQRITLTAP